MFTESLGGISPSSSCSCDPDAEAEAAADLVEEGEGLWTLAWSWWDSNLRKRVGVVVYHDLAVDVVVVAVRVLLVVVEGIRAVVERELWKKVQR